MSIDAELGLRINGSFLNLIEKCSAFMSFMHVACCTVVILGLICSKLSWSTYLGPEFGNLARWAPARKPNYYCL